MANTFIINSIDHHDNIGHNKQCEKQLQCDFKSKY